MEKYQQAKKNMMGSIGEYSLKNGVAMVSGMAILGSFVYGGMLGVIGYNVGSHIYKKYKKVVVGTENINTEV